MHCIPGKNPTAAIYRGAKCPTLKTAENSRKGCRAGRGKTAEKQPKHPKNSQNSLFFGCFGCSSSCFSAGLPRSTRYRFRLFFGCFQCRAFGTSVDGRRDCNPRKNPTEFHHNWHVSAVCEDCDGFLWICRGMSSGLA